MALTRLRLEKRPNDQVIDLLNNSVIGTPGKGMLYKHCDVPEKINHIRDPRIFNLEHGKKLVGTCTFCARDLSPGMKGFYVRYFTFLDRYRKRIIPTDEPVVKQRFRKKNNIIRHDVLQILKGEELVQDPVKDNAVIYAYVDPDNERSVELCVNFGFEKIGQFATVLFSRFFPKVSPRVSKIENFEKPIIKSHLVQYYSEYAFYNTENLFYEDNYYVLYNTQGDIVAGVQANPVNWKVLKMPGVTGTITMKVIPFLPILGRLFSPDYTFIAFEALFVKQGYEDQLIELFESILALNKLHSAIIWVDPQTDTYKMLKSLNLGFLDKTNKEVRIDIIGKFINCDASYKAMLKTSPAYISGFDLT